MSESPLARAMRFTSTLKYDDLRDLLVCIRHHHAQLIHSTPINADVTHCYELAAAAQASSDSLLLTAYIAMTRIDTPADMLALQQMVETLVNALQPDIPHDDPRGYIELRWIPRLRWNTREGILRVWYGPYAYLRHRTDSERGVYRTIYLGRDVADLYTTGRMSLSDIIDAVDNADLKTLKRQAKAQHPDIPASDLPDPPQPPVPFDLYPDFIGMVNEGKLKRYDVVKLYTPLILNGLESGVISQSELYTAYRSGTLDDFRRDLKRQLGTDDE